MIDALIDRVDALLIGGAMAFTFIAADGGDGRGRASSSRTGSTRCGQPRAKRDGARGADQLPGGRRGRAGDRARRAPRTTVPAHRDPDGGSWRSTSARGRSRSSRTIIADAKTILWNGPMGVFELEPFSAGTRGVAHGDRRAPTRSRWSAAATRLAAVTRPGSRTRSTTSRPAAAPPSSSSRAARSPASRSWRHRDDRTATDHRGQLEDAQDAPGGDPGGAEAQLPPGQGRRRDGSRS